jgi:hypothetical protein
MFDICEECGHSMSMHYGVVDMGGGHSEPIGCMHSTGPLKNDRCPCMEYDKDVDYE